VTREAGSLKGRARAPTQRNQSSATRSPIGSAGGKLEMRGERVEAGGGLESRSPVANHGSSSAGAVDAPSSSFSSVLFWAMGSQSLYMYAFSATWESAQSSSVADADN
jgi:hypothetical protein